MGTKESTIGQIVNLISVDLQRFMDIPAFLQLLWSGPLAILISMILLWQQLGIGRHEIP